MLIRAGYTLSFDCDAMTPLIAMLNLHPSRRADSRTPYELSIVAATDREDIEMLLATSAPAWSYRPAHQTSPAIL